MNEIAEGRKSFLAGLREDYKALSTKQVIAIIAAIALSLILTVFGYARQCCLAPLIVAVLLYMIPHLMKVSSVKVKAVIGVIFIVFALLLGVFAFTGINKELDGRASVSESYDSDFKDVEISDDHVLTFEVKIPSGYTDGGGWDVRIGYAEINRLSFGAYQYKDLKELNLASSELNPLGDSWYSCTVSLSGMTAGKLYVTGIYVEDISETSAKIIGYAQIYRDTGISSTDMMLVCFYGSLITVGEIALLFFVILIFSHMMRNSAEKSRSKMEAEGRLYPKGYGLCKSCGATVLPGEVVCRKCGEYIEVPEELKPKKADFFVCSECGAEVPSDAEVCPKCGTRFDEEEETEVEHPDGSVDTTTDTVPCPHCGEQIPSNADWCPKCGKKVKG